MPKLFVSTPYSISQRPTFLLCCVSISLCSTLAFLHYLAFRGAHTHGDVQSCLTLFLKHVVVVGCAGQSQLTKTQLESFVYHDSFFLIMHHKLFASRISQILFCHVYRKKFQNVVSPSHFYCLLFSAPDHRRLRDHPHRMRDFLRLSHPEAHVLDDYVDHPANHRLLPAELARREMHAAVALPRALPGVPLYLHEVCLGVDGYRFIMVNMPISFFGATAHACFANGQCWT
jgi:hypothetical protein